MLRSKTPKAPARVSRLLQKLLRQAYQVESLEPRILLSADPAAAALQLLPLRDGQEVAYPSLATEAPAPAAGETVLPDARDGALPQDFQVDAQAFADTLADTRASFMESALALGDPTYVRFVDDLFAVDALSAPADALAVDLSRMPLTGTEPAAQPGELLALEGRLFDAAELLRDVSLADVRSLLVQPGATLGGSGVLQAPTTVQGKLSPGYSPGELTYTDGLSLDGNAVTVIELGGTGAGSYDQIHVTGGLTLGGELQLSLWGGFVPQEGDVFTFLTFDQLDGTAFNTARGLVDAAHGLYFDITQSAGALSLTAHRLDATTTALVSALSGVGSEPAIADLSFADVVGMAINPDYFQQALAIDGALDLGENLHLQGSLSLGRAEGLSIGGVLHDAWRIGIEDGSARLGGDAQDATVPGV